MHHPTDRLAHTTVFGTPVVEHSLEREIVQWVHPWRIDPTTHRTMNERPRSLFLTDSTVLLQINCFLV